MGLVPAHVDREPRAGVSYPPGRHAAPRHRLTLRLPWGRSYPGIRTRPRGSWAVNAFHVTPLLTRKIAMDRSPNAVSGRAVPPAALLVGLLGMAPRPEPDAPSQVSVRLSEWKVELSQQTIAAGAVRFAVTNAGSIPHGFEVTGQGLEKEIETIQPGSSDTLTLSLKPGSYELYCPVGDDSHKKLGMETHLKVVGSKTSGSAGYGRSPVGESPHPGVGQCPAAGGKGQGDRGRRGGAAVADVP